MFKLQIRSADKRYFEGDVKALIAPGSDGYLEILSNHAPLVALLKKGTLTYRDALNATQTLDIESGLLEISDHKATILL
jgi:F-type H+-transporting ATPase subunit epsilon